jgi:hypothetical protein
MDFAIAACPRQTTEKLSDVDTLPLLTQTERNSSALI